MAADTKTDIYHAPILVVDDDGFFRRLVRQNLTGLGFQKIFEADSGKAAINQIATRQFGLLIVDVQMPHMNGLELLRKIRSGATDAPRDAPVIILTSFSETPVLRSAMALDVNGFMVKPMTPAVLRAKVLAACSESIPLKAATDYGSVNIDIGGVNGTSGSAGKPATAASSVAKPVATDTAQPTAPETEEQVPGCSYVSLVKLEPGMTIGKEIIAKDGSLLLRPGITLTTNMINRLIEVHDVMADPKVWVVNSENSGG
jgi:CheY-like chemotaxis protein